MSTEIDCPLDVTQRLFEGFEAADLRYVHWKSNEHLEAGLTGDTDLDILVDDGANARSVLADTGFKRFDLVPELHYPGMEDYLGFDEATGELIHIHLHDRLILGHSITKDHELPWIETIMDRRVRDADFGVYRTDPAMELLLLLIRYALKLRARDFVTQFRTGYLGEDIVREFGWLKEHTAETTVEELARDLLTDEAAAMIPELLDAPPTARQFFQFRHRAAPVLDRHRRLNPAEQQYTLLQRLSYRALARLNEAVLHRPRWYRRIRPDGGLRIAVIGVDGAGKSTVTKELTDWLGWKLSVDRTYFGSGEGSSSWLRKPIKFARGFVDDRAPSVPGSNDEQVSDRPFHLRVGRILRGLVLARERYRKYRHSKRAATHGAIVVSDRFPQSQITGFSDGPMLEYLSRSRSVWFRRLAEIERDRYERIQADPPDLVIKLAVDPAVSAQRIDDMTPEQLGQRAAAIRSISFETEEVTIDANEPIEDVLLQVKQAVWERL